MEAKIEIGERCVMVGADGKPEVVVEVVAVIQEIDATTYRVRQLGRERTREVGEGELYRLRAPS